MAGIFRPMSQMRKLETKEAVFRTRKRILRYLVLNFMKQEGLSHSAEVFEQEAGLNGEYEVCDNIDLDIILQDYCSYYLARFNKQPQFCKKVEEPAPPRRPPTRARVKADPEVAPPPPPGSDLTATVHVVKIGREEKHDNSTVPSIETKPLSVLLSTMSAEKKELAEQLYKDMIRPAAVSWDDIKGLDSAKSLLMESVVYPVRFPEVFTGVLEPWRGVLLHGPPGTGKTLLARAVASESTCTFFNVSSSTVVNKWRGESEKIVKVLFEMASYYSPSIIFIDEVETLVSERAAGEHEASRRLKAELLTELDGIADRQGVVFLLANSNMPWEIDPAMLRRLEKRIHIPLPDFKTRVDLFETFLSSQDTVPLSEAEVEELAANTEGYSGSDIKLVCKEAIMTSVRKILNNMEKGANVKRERKTKEKLELSVIMTAIGKTKPVSKKLAKRHLKWHSEMGCS